MPNNCTRCNQPGHNIRTCSNPLAPRITRHRGAQPGNTNALRHGFYSENYKKRDLQSQFLNQDHIDLRSEINLIRIDVKRVFASFNNDLAFKDYIAVLNIIIRASGRIGHLIKLHKLIENDSYDNIEECVGHSGVTC